MTEEDRQNYALLRYGIIAPAVTNMLPEDQTLKKFFEDAADKTYTLNGKEQKFHATTIERWYYAYKNHGFEALIQQPRSDNGASRKIDAEIEARIREIKTASPRIPATEIHNTLVNEGLITANEISLSTITRCVSRIVMEVKLPVTDEMRRYERPHINEVWCGDSCVGPKIKIGDMKMKQRLYIIALLDDASRLVPRAMVFHHDNFNSLLTVMKSAVRRYGVPKVWNFDNGATYKNRQMQLLAARIGSDVHYCRPYTPTQKAKIERWFRTLRDKWLATTDLNKFTTLEEVQASLDRFVDNYNRTVHSSLNGKTPEERFFSEPECIRRLPEEDIDKFFLLEGERSVSADGVISIDNVEYEVDSSHAKNRVKIRYTPDMSSIYVVEDDNSLKPIRQLNKQENSKVKRKKVYLSGGDD